MKNSKRKAAKLEREKAKAREGYKPSKYSDKRPYQYEFKEREAEAWRNARGRR